MLAPVTELLVVDDSEMEDWRNTRRKVFGTYNANNVARINYFMKAKQLLQRHPKTDEYQESLTTGVPSRGWYWVLCFKRLDPSVSTQLFYSCEVIIDYWVKLWEQNQEFGFKPSYDSSVTTAGGWIPDVTGYNEE